MSGETSIVDQLDLLKLVYVVREPGQQPTDGVGRLSTTCLDKLKELPVD